jgi:hypothetical protein
VGRPGLDPGTLGLKETFKVSRDLDPVSSVDCFKKK